MALEIFTSWGLVLLLTLPLSYAKCNNAFYNRHMRIRLRIKCQASATSSLLLGLQMPCINGM
jgi:hypothetical protein